MLYYLIIYFFVIGSFASQQKFLVPDSKGLLSFINPTNPTYPIDPNGNKSLSQRLIREILDWPSLNNGTPSSDISHMIRKKRKSETTEANEALDPIDISHMVRKKRKRKKLKSETTEANEALDPIDISHMVRKKRKSETTEANEALDPIE